MSSHDSRWIAGGLIVATVFAVVTVLPPYRPPAQEPRRGPKRYVLVGHKLGKITVGVPDVFRVERVGESCLRVHKPAEWRADLYDARPHVTVSNPDPADAVDPALSSAERKEAQKRLPILLIEAESGSRRHSAEHIVEHDWFAVGVSDVPGESFTLTLKDAVK